MQDARDRCAARAGRAPPRRAAAARPAGRAAGSPPRARAGCARPRRPPPKGARRAPATCAARGPGTARGPRPSRRPRPARARRSGCVETPARHSQAPACGGRTGRAHACCGLCIALGGEALAQCAGAGCGRSRVCLNFPGGAVARAPQSRQAARRRARAAVSPARLPGTAATRRASRPRAARARRERTPGGAAAAAPPGLPPGRPPAGGLLLAQPHTRARTRGPCVSAASEGRACHNKRSSPLPATAAEANQGC